MERKTISYWLAATCLLHFAVTVAQPVKDNRDVAVSGGSVAKMFTPPLIDMFHPQSEHGPSKRDSNWIIQAGDTGNGIAARLGVEFTILASMNPTVEWQNLQLGQVLTIPCGDDDMPSTSTIIHYTVVVGDTGNSIAGALGITFAALSAANPGVNWYNLQIGQVLDVPTSTVGSSISSTISTVSDALMKTILTTPSPTSLLSTSALTTRFIFPNTTRTTTSSVSSSATFVDSEAPATDPTGGPGTSSFFTPGGSKREADLPIVNIRLTRNERAKSSYIVKAGDIGLEIAAIYNITFNGLSDANPGVVWTNLQIGQTLNLPVTTGEIQGAGHIESRVRKTGADVYIAYSGPAAIPPYPAMSSWLSFDALWKTNLANIGTNCAFSSGSVPINTKAETAVLRKTILAVATHTSVSPSFILAMILQESAGCVRAPTTKSWEGISNPGLMQSFKGRYTCNTGSRVMQPCSSSMIRSMIMDGVRGNVNVGIVPALKTAASSFGASWPVASTSSGADVTHTVDEALLYYQAARIYNSGSLPADGDLSGVTGSTRCCVSDIANRLTGWVNAKKECS